MRFLALALLTLFVPAVPASDRVPAPQAVTRPAAAEKAAIAFSRANDELWAYLKKGLTYLESPTPLKPAEAVAPTYVHPDGRGFGAYGFSPEAYEDVQRLYPYFRAYSWDQVLASQKLYDLANRALCDWMLKSLRGYIPPAASKRDVFLVLHKAWNLGVGGFKKGREVVPSRTRRAEEFLRLNG